MRDLFDDTHRPSATFLDIASAQQTIFAHRRTTIARHDTKGKSQLPQVDDLLTEIYTIPVVLPIYYEASDKGQPIHRCRYIPLIGLIADYPERVFPARVEESARNRPFSQNGIHGIAIRANEINVVCV